MAKRKKNRKPTIAQLKEKLENVKERSMLRLAMTLARKDSKLSNGRGKKRAKDAKNHWSKDWE
jgi:hypothetical protein